MSEFKVEVVEISSVVPHPNADRLDLVMFAGMAYQVVIAKGKFKVGDLAYYFPIDSVIPDRYLDEFEIRTYYKKKIRATKLRGIFSEGLLVEVGADFAGKIGDDYAETFGVTKFEYPIPPMMNGDMEGQIGRYKFPSPEHLKRYKDLFKDGEEIVITEKIHGTNFSVIVEPDGEVKIASHRYFWKDNEANSRMVYIRTYHDSPALQQLPLDVQVYGEIYGVQDLKYGLKDGKLDYAVFAVCKGREFLDYDDFIDFCEAYQLPRVPVLYRGPYSWEIVTQFNNADSVLAPSCMMEGVIVQPAIERTDYKLGRVVLKLISDRYLLRQDGTELH
jgi:RNA ligase (TIGR02306 family)